MPPASFSSSKTVTSNLSGCCDRAYAADMPEAPAPTMQTLFLCSDAMLFRRLYVVRGRSRSQKSCQYKFVVESDVDCLAIRYLNVIVESVRNRYRIKSRDGQGSVLVFFPGPERRNTR